MATLRELIDRANELRNNNQFENANRIYDLCLKEYPHNPELLFNKGLCIQSFDPQNAILYLKQSIIYNPQILNIACHNIRCIPEHNQGEDIYKTALNALIDLLNKMPDKLDIIYHKGVLQGNRGFYLEALSDFYSLINNENTGLSTNEEHFSNHQISKDVENSQIHVRVNTLSIMVPQISTDKKIEEYCYLLPVNPKFPQQNYYLDFGKYIGFTIKEIINIEPDYIDWCIMNIDKFCVSEVIFYDIHKNSLNNSPIYMRNVQKLQEWNKQTKQFGRIDKNDPNISFTDDGERLIIKTK